MAARQRVAARQKACQLREVARAAGELCPDAVAKGRQRKEACDELESYLSEFASLLFFFSSEIFKSQQPIKEAFLRKISPPSPMAAFRSSGESSLLLAPRQTWAVYARHHKFPEHLG